MITYNLKTRKMAVFAEMGKPPPQKLVVEMTGKEFSYTMAQVKAMDPTVRMMADVLSMMGSGGGELRGEYPIPDMTIDTHADLTWDQVHEMVTGIEEGVGEWVDQWKFIFEKKIGTFLMLAVAKEYA
jgi:hypothetical protein